MIANLIEISTSVIIFWKFSPNSDRIPSEFGRHMAKLKSTEAATKAANMLASKSTDKFTNRVWRDVRVMELFEGTSEIQKLIIGNITTGFKAFN